MRSTATTACLLFLLSACANTKPDHFYVLSPIPPATSDTRSAPGVQAMLKVTLPAAADRAQLTLNSSAEQVIVLEHERWAAPLSDLATQALARDIEHRRSDILVSSSDISRAKSTDLRISVDVVQMILHRGAQARIAVQWRILDLRSNKEMVGSGEFSAALPEADYAAAAQSISECLGLLADRLVQQLP
jgi:uncharacterized protein